MLQEFDDADNQLEFVDENYDDKFLVNDDLEEEDDSNSNSNDKDLLGLEGNEVNNVQGLIELEEVGDT
jgi:hypothetical protein